MEELCRMLAGMNAATLRYKVSTVMSQLMVCNGGTWFKFLHGFANLLISQLEATIDKKRCHGPCKNKPIEWQNSSLDGFIS